MTGLQHVDEPVLVEARSDAQGNPHPMTLVWRNHTFTISDRGREWLEEDSGGARRRCFLVRTVNGDTFELRLDLTSYSWRLSRAWLQSHSV